MAQASGVRATSLGDVKPIHSNPVRFVVKSFGLHVSDGAVELSKSKQVHFGYRSVHFLWHCSTVTASLLQISGAWPWAGSRVLLQKDLRVLVVGIQVQKGGRQ
jgi:hypothetical protein